MVKCPLPVYEANTQFFIYLQVRSVIILIIPIASLVPFLF